MSSLLAATRPSIRDVRRHPWRNLAAVILIAIPLWYLTTVLTVSHSEEEVTRSVAPYDFVVWDSDGQAPPLDGLLPEGFQATQVEAGSLSIPASGVPYATRALEYSRLTQGEVLLPEFLASRIEVEVGQTVATDAGDLTYAGRTPTTQALVGPGTELNDYGDGNAATTQWNITGPRQLNDEEKDHLREAGFNYRNEVDYNYQPPAVLNFVSALVAALCVAALLFLFISPAFTTSVGRQTRTFALMASQGASTNHLMLAVLAYGLVAGLIGATIGLIGGVITSVVWWKLTFPLWPLSIPFLLLLLGWVGGVLTAVGSAGLPAFLVSRSSIVRGLLGATNDRMMAWRRWMAIGPILLVVSFILQAVSYLVSSEQWAVRDLVSSLSSLALIIGIALTAPALVFAAGYLPGPLPLRLALRDLRRQALRCVPAVGAIAMIVFVGACWGTMSATTDRETRAAYDATYTDNAITVTLPEGSDDFDDATESAASQVEAIVGPVEKEVAYGISNTSTDAQFLKITDEKGFSQCYMGSCHYDMFRSISIKGSFPTSLLIATPGVLKAMGVDTSLADGEAVLASTEMDHSSATFALATTDNYGTEQTVSEGLTLPLDPSLPAAQSTLLPTRAAAEKLGVKTEPVGVLLFTSDPLTDEQKDAIEDLGDETSFSARALNNPYVDRSEFWWAGVVAVSTIVLTTLILALSVNASRRQSAQLFALGARPGLESRTFAWFGAVLALSGAVLGIVCGLAMAFFWSNSRQWSYFVPDWWLMGTALVVVPVVCAGIGWLMAPRLNEESPLNTQQ